MLLPSSSKVGSPNMGQPAKYLPLLLIQTRSAMSLDPLDRVASQIQVVQIDSKTVGRGQTRTLLPIR